MRDPFARQFSCDPAEPLEDYVERGERHVMRRALHMYHDYLQMWDERSPELIRILALKTQYDEENRS